MSFENICQMESFSFLLCNLILFFCNTLMTLMDLEMEVPLIKHVCEDLENGN